MGSYCLRGLGVSPEDSQTAHGAHEPAMVGRDCQAEVRPPRAPRLPTHMSFKRRMFPANPHVPPLDVGCRMFSNPGFMESPLFLLDLLTGHEPKMHKSLQIKGRFFRFMGSFYIQELMHFGTMNRYDPVYSYRQDAPRPLSSLKEERAGVSRPRHSSLVTPSGS